MPTMKVCRPLIAENPIDEIWRQLRFFTDCEYATSKIIEKHGNDPEHSDNVKKQARQIGYCIRQGEEYFNAAKQVSLATQPVLLYYGAVSLSSALQLLCKDGDYSFDRLRQTGKHRHHGLEFDRGIQDLKEIQSIEHFLSSLKCDVYQKHGSPHGHFGIFYDCLVETGFRTKDVVVRGTHQFSMDSIYLGLNKQPIEKILDKKFSVLDLSCTLPDMFSYLKEVGIEPNLCPGSITRVWNDNESSLTISVNPTTCLTSTFTIDSTNKSHIDKLIPFLSSKIPNLQFTGEFEYNKCFEIKGIYQELTNTFFPDMGSDMYGQKFHIVDAESCMLEPAAYFSIMYCFGMLARYFPDIWMGALENAKIAQFINILLSTFLRKFPHLILNQLTSTLYYTDLTR
jgi:hypothetical protein